MKRHNRQSIILVFNETDPLGIYCALKSGVLCDYTGRRVPLNQEVWGALVYRDGKPIRRQFKEGIQ